MKKRIRSYFDVKTRELRESDPEGIRIIRVGPPFEPFLYDLRRMEPKLRLTIRFNLRKYFAKDKDQQHKALEHEVVTLVSHAFDCVLAGDAEEVAAARLLSELGGEWALQVARYPPALHARILFLADRVPRFRQLVLTCPGLATDVLRNALLACGKRLMGAAEYLTPLLQGNAKQIAGRFGWPSGTAGILHRLWPAAATFAAVDALKSRLTANDAAARRAKRILPHCSYISSDAVRLIGDDKALDRVEDSFLVKSCSRRPDQFQDGTGDWTRLSQLLHAEARFPWMRVPSIETPQQLQRLHDRYFAGYEPHDVDTMLDYDFPQPPFESDDPSFEHVEDPLAALAEAVEMGPNCQANLFPAVTNGEACIFRVMPDAEREIERATLVIHERYAVDGSSSWEIYDARTRFNQPIAKTTEIAINEFLQRNDPSMPSPIDEGYIVRDEFTDEVPF